MCVFNFWLTDWRRGVRDKKVHGAYFGASLEGHV